MAAKPITRDLPPCEQVKELETRQLANLGAKFNDTEDAELISAQLYAADGLLEDCE